MKRFNDYLRLLEEARTFSPDIDDFDYVKYDKAQSKPQFFIFWNVITVINVVDVSSTKRVM